MNESDLTRFAALIEARMEDLEAQETRGRAGRDVVELDQQAIGRLSRMDALQNQAMAQAQAARRSGEAARLVAAQERIADGSYGQCEDCGEDIPHGRLKLDLAALRCVSCATG